MKYTAGTAAKAVGKTNKTVSDQINARGTVVGLVPLLGRTRRLYPRYHLIDALELPAGYLQPLSKNYDPT